MDMKQKREREKKTISILKAAAESEQVQANDFLVSIKVPMTKVIRNAPLNYVWEVLHANTSLVELKNQSQQHFFETFDHSEQSNV